MKAVRLHSRGGSEQLVEEVVPLPDPATGEVHSPLGATFDLTPRVCSWVAADREEVQIGCHNSKRFPSGSTAHPKRP